jgi:hypothetical protein
LDQSPISFPLPNWIDSNPIDVILPAGRSTDPLAREGEKSDHEVLSLTEWLSIFTLFFVMVLSFAALLYVIVSAIRKLRKERRTE